MPIHLHSDVLYDVLKFCNRFDINERFEFVDGKSKKNKFM